MKIFGSVRIEWVPRDLWLGAYVGPGRIYLCLLPMLPISWARRDTVCLMIDGEIADIPIDSIQGAEHLQK